VSRDGGGRGGCYEAFGKEHKHVMEAIRNILESDDFTRHNFVGCSYVNENNREMPMYVT